MPSAYYYSSTAGTFTITASITTSSTLVQINSAVGLPGSTPFKMVLDPGQTTEEIVKVTAIAGTSLTITRAWDGTTASAHSAGASARHMMTAEDFTLSRSHEAASVAVHGITGSVVGTTDAQALSNKDLSSATNTMPSTVATLTGTQALTNKDLTGAGNTFPSSLATSANLTAHTGASTGIHGVTGAVVGTTDTQALSNKDLTAATNTFPATLATSANLNAHTGATAAHGTTGAIVGTSDTQTLTNKNLASSTNVFPSRLTDHAMETDAAVASAAAGWSLTVVQGIRRNGWASIYVQAIPSSTISSSGGDVSNTVIGNMTTAYAPAIPASGATAASGPVASYTVWTDSTLSVTSAAGNLTAGANLSFCITYPLATP